MVVWLQGDVFHAGPLRRMINRAHRSDGPAVRLGLRENARQFTLLVLVNAFVGAVVGVERSVLPLLARERFGIVSSTALFGFVAEGGEDPRVAHVIEDAMRPHRAVVDELVGETDVLLHRGTVLESPMDNLLTSAYLASTGVDVALSHGWRYGTPIPPGPISAGDLWQMIPTNPELFTVRMTGDELRRMLEQSLERTFSGDLLRQQGGYVMRFAGMCAVVRLNNAPGTRVQQLEIGGVPAERPREYTIAAAGEQSVTQQKERSMTGVRAVDCMRAYLHTHAPAHTPATHRTLVAV